MPPECHCLQSGIGIAGLRFLEGRGAHRHVRFANKQMQLMHLRIADHAARITEQAGPGVAPGFTANEHGAIGGMVGCAGELFHPLRNAGFEDSRRDPIGHDADVNRAEIGAVTKIERRVSDAHSSGMGESETRREVDEEPSRAMRLHALDQVWGHGLEILLV